MKNKKYCLISVRDCWLRAVIALMRWENTIFCNYKSQSWLGSHFKSRRVEGSLFQLYLKFFDEQCNCWRTQWYDSLQSNIFMASMRPGSTRDSWQMNEDINALNFAENKTLHIFQTWHAHIITKLTHWCIFSHTQKTI